MSRRVNRPAGQKRRRRGLVWGFGVVAFVAALLYWEQAALLYVLSTLAVCGLLLVVAFSDLEGGGKESMESTRDEEASPAVGSEVTIATPSRRRRPAAKRTRRPDAA